MSRGDTPKRVSLPAGKTPRGAPGPARGGRRASTASAASRAQRTPGGGALGNTRIGLPQAVEQAIARRDRRSKRWGLLGQLREVSGIERLRKCRRVSIMPGGTVGVRIPGQLGAAGAGYSGLATCASVWACPCCAAKIAHARAEDLGQVLSWATSEGHTVALATMTMRHHAGQQLRDSWNALGKAWGRVTSGGQWEKATDRYGLLGFARAVEVTHGENGWHCHVHAVLVLEGPVSPQRVRLLGEHMFGVWERGLHSKGYTAVRDSGGLDVRVTSDETEERLAEYLCKQLAVEATHGHAKQGRRKGRTPFQIASDFFATGDMADLELWGEWEQASRGRRQLTWSQGLRELAGLAEDEATDDELAAEEAGDEDLLQLPAETWRAIRDTAAVTELLDVAEGEGLTGAMRWLRVRGLGFSALSVPGGRGRAP